MPLDTWMVVEPITYNEIKPVSTHATQDEAEAREHLDDGHGGHKGQGHYP